MVHRFPLPGTLAPGNHLLSISVHNTAQASSDLRIGGITLVETGTESKPEQERGQQAPPPTPVKKDIDSLEHLEEEAATLEAEIKARQDKP